MISGIDFDRTTCIVLENRRKKIFKTLFYDWRNILIRFSWVYLLISSEKISPCEKYTQTSFDLLFGLTRREKGTNIQHSITDAEIHSDLNRFFAYFCSMPSWCIVFVQVGNHFCVSLTEIDSLRFVKNKLFTQRSRRRLLAFSSVVSFIRTCVSTFHI